MFAYFGKHNQLYPIAPHKSKKKMGKARRLPVMIE